MNLLNLWNSIESYLFPVLETSLEEELSIKEQEFVRVCSVSELENHIMHLNWQGVGRKPKDRLSILKAFVAKAVYNLSTTRALIDYLNSSPTLRRLCGWESKSSIPHESKFSRIFSQISDLNLCEQIHKSMVIKHCSDHIVGHLSRDSTSIDGREKAVPKLLLSEEKPIRKRGRPKKGEEPPKKVRLVEIQPKNALEDNLKMLPISCNKGTKKNSNGYKVSWKGYKLHVDCIDGDIPVSAILTSASLHDSQAAIPLAQMSNERVTSLYDLMDAAYDSPEIHQFSRELGHIPIIDHNKRRGEKKIFDCFQKRRYYERSTAERVNSNLKDNYGGRNIRVKGHKKVLTHLMFGIIAITANQLFKLVL
ncbi:MAG: transposase [Proteobacteria bacterium]|nr:transposase [Pseudomonadota bacterium]